ncbi:MAG: ribosome recycling factor [Candidatus Portnoybacteria bacterium CG10_big_fil_rev_8_21_14_0_10_36_7]|uniref:Ribosome-recycling factor n=1 Tax=Candidatus Portnoybacteria bacterium CG10_big_fil_rev_8_21_14_0_10_36_7 TaxID=1974812 RepID=A0A2M8KEN9_9BACT|nr:MAG: ribosome recycling factor [Candidatus Portnoybacteria bacterium CG10_big_fil_rev_8_21_14_0_10_36_7]
MYKTFLDNLKKDLDKAMKHFKLEVGSLHTGGATPAILEDVAVLAYGSSMPLKQLAVITTAEARVLSVQPWDRTVLRDIEKAIRNQKPNLSPSVSGDIVRVVVPGLNEEQRKSMVKMLGQKAEESRIVIRRNREDAWKNIQSLEKEKQLREDDKFRAKDELQKIVDDYNDKIESFVSAKEKEIMTI